MKRYANTVIQEVCRLRSLGKTYSEIRKSLQINIPKSTLSEWCKNISLPQEYSERIVLLNINHLNKARLLANEVNRIKREKYLNAIHTLNLPIAQVIENKEVAKIALAMLCLGEASKSKNSASFYFGNSDPKIIMSFLELMRRCFDFDITKVRCTVQCRADQDSKTLEDYWMNITNIPKHLFYKSRIDMRTSGKPTKKVNYRGVLRVDYFDSNVRYELESLADLIYNRLIA